MLILITGIVFLCALVLIVWLIAKHYYTNEMLLSNEWGESLDVQDWPSVFEQLEQERRGEKCNI